MRTVSNDRLRRPQWLIDAMSMWSPTSYMPQALTDAMRPVAELFGFAPAAVVKDLIDSVAARLSGRRLTLQLGDHEVTLVLRTLQLERPPVGLVVGQVGDVRIEADDVSVGGSRITHVVLDAHNVHLQPGVDSATIVAAPIHVRASLDPDTLRAHVADRVRRFELELRDSGGRAYIAGRRSLGHVDFAPRVEGRTLLLQPVDALMWRWEIGSLVRRLPALRFALPTGLEAAHITGVGVQDGQLIVAGVYEEWRSTFTAQEFDGLRRRIDRYDGTPLRMPRSRVGHT